jgi:hypothetical protein
MAKTINRFASHPHTVVALMDDGRYVNLGTYSAKVFAQPVQDSALKIPGVAEVEMIVTLPEALD